MELVRSNRWIKALAALATINMCEATAMMLNFARFDGQQLGGVQPMSPSTARTTGPGMGEPLDQALTGTTGREADEAARASLNRALHMTVKAQPTRQHLIDRAAVVAAARRQAISLIINCEMQYWRHFRLGNIKASGHLKS
jgi:hypothetical protein